VIIACFLIFINKFVNSYKNKPQQIYFEKNVSDNLIFSHKKTLSKHTPYKITDKDFNINSSSSKHSSKEKG